MSRRRITIAFSGFLAVVVTLVAWWSFERFGPGAYTRRLVYQACYHPNQTDPAAIRKIGREAVPYLIKVLKVRDTNSKLSGFIWRLRWDAPDWAQKCWPYPPAAATLHARAGRLLQELGPAAKPALPELICCLEAEKSEWAVDAIGSIGQDAQEALPALHAALTNGNRFLRVSAAAAIWDVGKETNTTLDILMPMIRTKNKGELIIVVMAANHMDQLLRESVATALVERLQNTTRPNERSDAAVALGCLRVQDEPTQCALLLGTRDSDPDLRRCCAATLWRLWPTTPICASLGTRAYLEWEISQKRNRNPVNFVQRAKNLEIDPTTAIPALKECLNDNDPEIRRQAAEALRLMESSTRSSP